MDTGTGDISLKEKLNYDRDREITLVYRATDGGGQHTDVQVNITVENTNDQGPVFQGSKTYTIWVNEGNTTLNPSIRLVVSITVFLIPSIESKIVILQIMH